MTLEQAKPWVGAQWSAGSRILILGESWYGKEQTIASAIEDWIERRKPDWFFSRVFNTCSDYRASECSDAERRGFWETVAFHNFVYWSVGISRDDRPTKRDYARAEGLLADELQRQSPRGVWILGKGQGQHSGRIVEASRIVYEIAPHPCSRKGATTALLRESWVRLQQRVQGA